MALKLISKNNIGIMATLILVVLLCQPRYFIFLTGTTLGKMFLLAMLIMLTYFNKIFGILGVIFVIVAFNLNHSNAVQSYNFYEGYKGNSEEDSKKATKKNDAKYIDETEKEVNADTLTTTSSNNDETEKEINAETFTTTSSSVSGSEGFCMPDRELNILRGKQSNAIPVFNKSRENINEVDPADKSAFSSDYAPY